MKFKKERNQMNYAEKLCCISYFPKESLKDEDASIRLNAYRALGFTKEALKDQHYRVRLEAYRAL
ncbi:MAG: HEAT repeat domain-containing protein [Saprospiraceae bacterium]|nr:HEAT repeat domain-containing protein [Saprospiraceae bacterium]